MNPLDSASGGPDPHLVTALPGQPCEAPTARHGHAETASSTQPDPVGIPDALISVALDAADTCPCGHTYQPCCIRRGLAAAYPHLTATQPQTPGQTEPGS